MGGKQTKQTWLARKRFLFQNRHFENMSRWVICHRGGPIDKFLSPKMALGAWARELGNFRERRKIFLDLMIYPSCLTDGAIVPLRAPIERGRSWRPACCYFSWSDFMLSFRECSFRTECYWAMTKRSMSLVREPFPVLFHLLSKHCLKTASVRYRVVNYGENNWIDKSPN